MQPRVLVTGGCGFIGREVVNELVQRGYFVRVADDLSAPGSQELSGNSCELVRVDLCDRRATLAAFDGIDTCVALAAKSAGIGFFNTHPAQMLDDNLRILSSTFAAALAHRLKKIVYVSSSCIFDNSPAHPITEAAHYKIPVPPTGYPFSKLTGEIYCRAYRSQYGLPYTIIRPFNVYGPGDIPGCRAGDSHVIPDLAAKIITGQNPLEIFGSGEQTRSFTYVTDVARGIALATESPAAIDQDFNLGHYEEVTIRQLAERLWRLCSRKGPLALKCVTPFKHDVPRRAVDITKARTVLGWEPEVDLDQGLTRYISWLRARGMLEISPPSSVSHSP